MVHEVLSHQSERLQYSSCVDKQKNTRLRCVQYGSWVMGRELVDHGSTEQDIIRTVS